MAVKLRSANIIESFKILKGNTRTSITFEPMWGIPFVLYNFYLSLYMKGLGITDKQIGYLISIGFISGAFFSLFAGIITDRLGRKRTTLIFDFVSWPLAILIYALSNNFWMFALATIVNSSVRIVAVSFNMMVIEDADNEQRVAAFNLINVINISTGVLVPLGGLMVNALGVVKTERIFMLFATVSMTAMMLLRNHFYTETRIGKQILEENNKKSWKDSFSKGLYSETFKVLAKKPAAVLIMCLVILFNIYVPIGTFSSLYFAPYMTEVLGIGKSTVSILGGVYSAVMFVIFVLVNPVISNLNKNINMLAGLIIQAVSLLMLIVIPENNIYTAIVGIALFAVGFGIYRPFMDSLLAEVTEGRERAGIYSLVNTIICILTAIVGFVSGYIYELNPRSIYMVSIVILMVCVVLLVLYRRRHD